MKLRRYIGKDMQEAMLKVKMELGNEAIILNTKKIRQKGFWKFFSKPLIELLVGVDDYSAKVVANTEKDDNSKADDKKADDKKVNDSKVDDTKNDTITDQEIDKHALTKEEKGKIIELENRLNGMQEVINKVYEEIKNAKKHEKEGEDLKSSPTKSIVKNLFYNNLIKNDVEPDIANKIMDEVLSKMKDSSNVNEAAGIMCGILSNMLGDCETIKLTNQERPTVVLFLGPTGVGKTTTLAKLAAEYALSHEKKIGLITADTYRIAAVDQLKTYADIIGIPVEVIYSPEEVSTAIEKFADKDLILIDTAGRSVKEKEQFDELSKLVEYSMADEVFLVLSSTTSASNCKEIIETYSFLKDYKLIFTKLDETSVTGVILNARHYTNKKLSYFTIGQDVPEDIEIADTQRLTKNLLGSLRR